MEREKKTANMGKYQKHAYLRRKAQLKAQYDMQVAERSEKLKYMLANNIPTCSFDMLWSLRDPGRFAPTVIPSK
jgi:hypothetical protein